MKRFFVFLLLLSLFLIPACKNESGESPAPTSDSGSYRQITQEEAKRMMALDDGHIILDVRREDEYDSGHIPGAVLLPNEEIGTERPAKLPKLDQIILVYCRSGRRSKEAAEKLAKMGYTQIYEFGGILTWDGETVTTKEESAKPEKTAQLRYSTFSGGGPEYSGSVQDPSILSFQIAYDFGDAASEVIDGASYDVIFTLIGLRPGETLFTVSGRSPIAGNFEILYHVTVSKENTVEIEELSYTDLDALVTPVPVSVVIEVNGKTLYMDLEENPSANDFFSHLRAVRSRSAAKRIRRPQRNSAGSTERRAKSCSESSAKATRLPNSGSNGANKPEKEKGPFPWESHSESLIIRALRKSRSCFEASLPRRPGTTTGAMSASSTNTFST